LALNGIEKVESKRIITGANQKFTKITLYRAPASTLGSFKSNSTTSL